MKETQKKNWKRLVLNLTAALVLAFCVNGLAIVSLAASTGKVKTEKGGNANIRKEADTTSTAVGSAANGSPLEILSEVKGKDGKTWYQVKSGNTTGYIRSDLVEVTSQSTGEDNKQDEPIVAGGAEALVPVAASVSGSNTVRVRTSASTANSNNILTTLASGNKVTVVARTKGDDGRTWYQIKFTANNKEALGYIREDYLTIDGEIKTAAEAEVTPVPETTPEATPQATPPAEHVKRYETKKINDTWYILDYEIGEQFKIEDLFQSAEEYKKHLEEEKGKTPVGTVWIVLLGLVCIALVGFSGYLLYRLREMKEEAFIASIENGERPRPTAERPSREARPRRKPAIREGIDDDEDDEDEDDEDEGARRPHSQRPGRPVERPQGQRPAQPGERPQGQRPAQPGERPQGQRPAQPAERPQGQRPAQAGGRPQGQRPAQAGGRPQGQRPAQPGERPQGQRPAQAGERPQGQRPAQAGERPQGQRPAQTAERPQSQRPAQTAERPQSQRPAQTAERPHGQRPAQTAERPQSQRPAQTAERPQSQKPAGQPAGGAKKSKNFIVDDDDFEFEFLNWDSDEE